jgi:insecticidal toxin complex protein TccC
MRPLAVEENGQPNVETVTYADASADPVHNLRGQLSEQRDRSGTLSFDSYSLLGQPLRDTRTLLEGKPYRSSRIYSPLGTVLSQTDAGDHQQQSRYDIAGQLKQVELRLKDSPNWQPVLKDAQYNAAGQIIEQRAGNDVLSTWTYDPADGRLSKQRAQKNAEPALQNFEYFYDRVGNISRIEDHAFKPIYFANQLIDGHRDFTYDSLYRLTSATGYDDAPPSDIPGRPLPGDPNNRLNYTQHYTYDAGNNLIKLCHEREGACHTREMFIDPGSNHGVRWKPGDPDPVFSRLFDRHGNLNDLQQGKTLTWNSLDQLESVTLVKRDDGLHDQEFYRYSQGVRVYKRHETQTRSLTHFQEVIYLPGLEIRTRDNGEELHVITLPGGHGSVRCLHWVIGKPAKIAADQLRYSLDDHLGSCATELDQDAQVISEEGYYPFGATAWYARGSEVDVDYKTIRYSGKEMDDSGLYYYGARYYAPWLQRWVSADPAGDVDGLNLYAMVGNNPLVYVDRSGTFKAVFEVAKGFVGVLGKAKSAVDQIHNLATEFDGLVPEGADIAEVRQSMTLGKFLRSKHGVKSILKGAIAGGTVASALGSVAPGIGTGIGFAVGMIVGAIAMPLLRYHFFKKGLKLAETLHTQEIKDGLSTAVDTTNKVIDGAQSIANGGRDLIDKIKKFADSINTYPVQIQDLFYKQLGELTSENQREAMKLLHSGIDPFEAITQVLEKAQAIVDVPSEAEGASQRLAQLVDEVANPVSERPIPKPRKLIQKLQRRNSESIA